MLNPEQLQITPGIAPHEPLRWRGLGQWQDLDIDFHTQRTSLVTHLLRNCVEPPLADDSLIWQLSVSARVGGLLSIYHATTHQDILPLLLHCPVAACAELMDFSLPVDQLVSLARDAENSREISLEDASGSVNIRRPTGEDQRNWRQQSYINAEQAQRAMLETLLLDESSEIPAHALQLIDEGLQKHDPLTCFLLDAECPHCGTELQLPVDLEKHVIEQLARSSRALISDVHRIARVYGWDERTILSIPAQRRRYYIQLIDADKSVRH